MWNNFTKRGQTFCMFSSSELERHFADASRSQRNVCNLESRSEAAAIGCKGLCGHQAPLQLTHVISGCYWLGSLSSFFEAQARARKDITVNTHGVLTWRLHFSSQQHSNV